MVRLKTLITVLGLVLLEPIAVAGFSATSQAQVQSGDVPSRATPNTGPQGTGMFSGSEDFERHLSEQQCASLLSKAEKVEALRTSSEYKLCLAEHPKGNVGPQGTFSTETAPNKYK
jgi:hypothetical protein